MRSALAGIRGYSRGVRPPDACAASERIPKLCDRDTPSDNLKATILRLPWPIYQVPQKGLRQKSVWSLDRLKATIFVVCVSVARLGARSTATTTKCGGLRPPKTALTFLRYGGYSMLWPSGIMSRMETLDFRKKELATFRFREVLGVAVLRVQELLRGFAERVPAAMQLRKAVSDRPACEFCVCSFHFLQSPR